jgi:hypothetical protein
LLTTLISPRSRLLLPAPPILPVSSSPPP